MPTRGCDRFQAITVRRMRAVSIRIRQPHDGPAADRRSATPWTQQEQWVSDFSCWHTHGRRPRWLWRSVGRL